MHKISAKKIRQLWLGLFGILCCIALDQVTKQLAIQYLKDAPAVPLIPGVFELSYLENHGAAFGIMQGWKTFLILMTIVTLVILTVLYIRIPEDRHFLFIRLIVLLLISGAIGNFIDRCQNDYVVDFFYFSLIDFPVFNVADIYVTVGACLLMIVFSFYYKEEEIDMLLRQLVFWKKKEKH